MSFPKKGKFFPKENRYTGNGGDETDGCFVDEIASALRRSLGDSRAGVKTVASWTGANEKTVKNWFAGKYGPSGEHLVALARHSDEVLGTFLEHFQQKWEPVLRSKVRQNKNLEPVQRFSFR